MLSDRLVLIRIRSSRKTLMVYRVAVASGRAAVQDMDSDHDRLYVATAEKIPNRADIVTRSSGCVARIMIAQGHEQKGLPSLELSAPHQLQTFHLTALRASPMWREPILLGSWLGIRAPQRSTHLGRQDPATDRDVEQGRGDCVEDAVGHDRSPEAAALLVDPGKQQAEDGDRRDQPDDTV